MFLVVTGRSLIFENLYLTLIQEMSFSSVERQIMHVLLFKGINKDKEPFAIGPGDINVLQKSSVHFLGITVSVSVPSTQLPSIGFYDIQE